MLIKIRKYINSHKLFSNWLSATINYVIIRLILSKFSSDAIRRGCIKVKCKSGGKACINPLLYTYLIWYFSSGFLRSVKCDTENNALIINGLRIELSFHDNYVDLGSVKFKHYYVQIFETFLIQDYSAVDVSGRVVVDVGGFVGDSAIYFVLRGAKRVYAIEPHPGAYQEMLENIKLNNMQDRIVPINAALGSKPGKIRIPDINTKATGGAYYGPESNGDLEIPMTTLSQLINDYGIEPDILKMDCEGCEYDIILNDYENVRLFRELIFELHEYRGPSKELMNKLINDYRCREVRIGKDLEIVHCVRLW